MSNDEPKLSGSETYSARRIIFREWLPYLSVNEIAVLVFLFERTFGWRKRSEVVTANHFLVGVFERAGEDLIQGRINLSRSSLFKTIASLERRGLIIRSGISEHPRSHKRYAINVIARPDRKARSNSSSSRNGAGLRPAFILRRPKIDQKRRLSTSAIRTPKINKSSLTIRKRNHNAGKTGGSSERVFSDKDKKGHLRGNAAIQAYHYEKVWKHRCSIAHPTLGTVDWTWKERTALYKAIRRLKGIDPDKLIDFAVSSWGQVLHYFLSKGMNSPRAPNVYYFVAHLQTFTQAFTSSGLPRSLMPEYVDQTNYKSEVIRLRRALEKAKAANERAKLDLGNAATSSQQFNKLRPKDRPSDVGLPEWDD